MIKSDYHVHSVYSDGRSTPGEIVLAAIAGGMTEIGFSDHSFSPADRSWNMPIEKYGQYMAEIGQLRRTYAGQIRVLCGLEQDLDSPPPPEGLDYLIGSVHFLQGQSGWYSVDESSQRFERAIREDYAGDPYALCADYYAKVARLGEVRPDIIGHLDLVTKFNEGGRLFDDSDPRYLKAATSAIDALLPLEKPFEINTGAISRGYRTAPYPAPALRDYIRARGGKFILCSDSHHKDTLMYNFEAYEEWV